MSKFQISVKCANENNSYSGDILLSIFNNNNSAKE